MATQFHGDYFGQVLGSHRSHAGTSLTKAAFKKKGDRLEKSPAHVEPAFATPTKCSGDIGYGRRGAIGPAGEGLLKQQRRLVPLAVRVACD